VRREGLFADNLISYQHNINQGGRVISFLRRLFLFNKK